VFGISPGGTSSTEVGHLSLKVQGYGMNGKPVDVILQTGRKYIGASKVPGFDNKDPDTIYIPNASTNCISNRSIQKMGFGIHILPEPNKSAYLQHVQTGVRIFLRTGNGLLEFPRSREERYPPDVLPPTPTIERVTAFIIRTKALKKKSKHCESPLSH
jgi:hypothetical protein